MRNPVFLGWACVGILAACCGGCTSISVHQETATEPEPKPAPRAIRQSVEPGATASDEEIGFEIRHRLNATPSDTAGIIVEVDDGKVTLRGTVPNLAAVWRAEAAARAAKGVKQVTNQILVAGTSR
jgi:osmotically-inducible protein OsmY